MPGMPMDPVMGNVLHTVAGLKEDSGGVSRSVPRLCEALAGHGCIISLVTQDSRGMSAKPIRVPDPALVRTHLVAGYDWERLRFSYVPGLAHLLERLHAQSPVQIIHDHGVWLHSNHVVASTAQRLGIRRVVSPRGMLERWSLHYRGWKKKLAWRAYQLADLQAACGFSATSRGEAQAIRELGFRQPIAVIPNGIDLPAMTQAISGAVQGVRTALFLSRLHPKKGLLELVQAWSRSARPDWRLVIAGPDENGYRGEVERAVAAAGIGAGVSFAGPVEGTAKQHLFKSADLFVLPSHSENFGIVIGEALAHGLPVITTDATPWESLQTERCGWWIGTGSPPLAAALSEAMDLPDGELRQMGRRGRALVERDYSWSMVADKHARFYAWLSGLGPEADCLFD